MKRKVINNGSQRVANLIFVLPERKYALLAFGASKNHPEKCWPYESFAEIANLLVQKNISSGINWPVRRKLKRVRKLLNYVLMPII